MTTVFQGVPEEWKGSNRLLPPAGCKTCLIISEQGLYFFSWRRSDKPKALPYQCG